MDNALGWATKDWTEENIPFSPRGAAHEINRLRKRVVELLESNNEYQQIARDQRDLVSRSTKAVDAMVADRNELISEIGQMRTDRDTAIMEMRKANEAANQSGFLLHEIKQELKATGHQHEGAPLDHLVDKAIDVERERHASSVASIATALGMPKDCTTKAPAFVARDAIEVINTMVSRWSMLCKALGLPPGRIDHKRALELIEELKAIADQNRPQSAPSEEEIASNADIERLSSRVGLIEQKVEQLMARADNEDPFRDLMKIMDVDNRRGPIR